MPKTQRIIKKQTIKYIACVLSSRKLPVMIAIKLRVRFFGNLKKITSSQYLIMKINNYFNKSILYFLKKIS